MIIDVTVGLMGWQETIIIQTKTATIRRRDT